MINEKGLKNHHEPVLLDEVIDLMRPDEIAHLHSDAQFIDATLGYGGHSVEFVNKGIFTFGIEVDKKAIQIAKARLSQACPTPQKSERCFKIIHGNFKDIDDYSQEYELNTVYGILFDLGVSSPQLVSKERGFSFQNPDAQLDMRMDPDSQAVTAADLLNSLPEKHLYQLFYPYLDHSQAKTLSNKVVKVRQENKFETVGDFLEILEEIGNEKEHIHKATLPFMALRIAVNTELEDLKKTLPKAFNILKKDGRLAVISFHSGEDRLVKRYFSKLVKQKKAHYPEDELIRPSEEEINSNPRARSAKLRVIQKK